jgi:hypothetical protein
LDNTHEAELRKLISVDLLLDAWELEEAKRVKSISVQKYTKELRQYPGGWPRFQKPFRSSSWFAPTP